MNHSIIFLCFVCLIINIMLYIVFKLFSPFFSLMGLLFAKVYRKRVTKGSCDIVFWQIMMFSVFCQMHLIQINYFLSFDKYISNGYIGALIFAGQSALILETLFIQIRLNVCFFSKRPCVSKQRKFSHFIAVLILLIKGAFAALSNGNNIESRFSETTQLLHL